MLLSKDASNEALTFFAVVFTTVILFAASTGLFVLLWKRRQPNTLLSFRTQAFQEFLQETLGLRLGLTAVMVTPIWLSGFSTWLCICATYIALLFIYTSHMLCCSSRDFPSGDTVAMSDCDEDGNLDDRDNSGVNDCNSHDYGTHDALEEGRITVQIVSDDGNGIGDGNISPQK
jgi:hypothetical protein